MIELAGRTLGLGASAGLVVLATVAFLHAGPEVENTLGPQVGPPELQSIPAIDRSVGSALLQRSPFAPDRSAFSREPIAAPVEYDVRLIGASRLGSEMAATLMINGSQVAVREGDETPIGPVEEIGRKSVKIGGLRGRTLDMFAANSALDSAAQQAASFPGPAYPSMPSPPTYATQPPPAVPATGPSIRRTAPETP